MKIVNLVRFFPKISETFILDNLIGQADNGIESVIVAYTDPRVKQALEDRQLEEGKHSIIDKYGFLDKTYYINPEEKEAFAKIIEKEKPDLIQIHFGDLAPMIFENNTLPEIPIIITYHGIVMPAKADTRHLEAENYRNTFDKANIILTVSDKWRNDLIALGAPEDKVKVHRLGVYYDKFAIKDYSKINIPLNGVSVGRLVEKKGFHTAIEAIKILQNKEIYIKYTIIGDGIEFDRLKEQTLKLPYPEYIEFLGKQPREFLEENLCKYDIFLAPSTTAADGDEEGIPVTIMEASAIGLPIVATYHGGIPELITNDINGTLVKENSPKELAEKLELLINNKILREDLGKEARNNAIQNYNGYTQNEKLIEIYKDLIERK